MEDKTIKEEVELELLPDAEGVEPEIADKIGGIKEKLKHCETERKEYLDGWQRAKADLINYKKAERERFENLARFAAAGFAAELLPVLDSFHLALGPGFSSGTEKGVLLIKSQLEDILRKNGLEEIKVDQGEELNPEKHESVGETESENEAGTVAEVVQKGYTFNGRVIRPARVKIAGDRSRSTQITERKSADK